MGYVDILGSRLKKKKHFSFLKIYCYVYNQGTSVLIFRGQRLFENKDIYRLLLMFVIKYNAKKSGILLTVLNEILKLLFYLIRAYMSLYLM